ncbi:MAG: DNA polymerase III subunit beta [Bacillota bacterium]
MRFKTTRDNLLAGISTVQRAVASRSPMPILQGILIEASDEGITFTGTDLELCVSCTLPATEVIPGAVVLPARYFAEIVRKLPDGTVSFVAELSSYAVSLRYGRAEARLNGYSAEEFPKLPEVTPKVTFEVKGDLLRDIVRQVVYAVGQDELRPIFTGVLLEIVDQEIRAVATDTHRLALRKADLPGSEAKLTNIIIPGKALGELARLLGGLEDEDVQVAVAESYASFSISQARILTRLIEGQFPDYQQVIPNSYKTRISEMNPVEFTRTVERAATLARDDAPVVVLAIKHGTLTVSARSQVGSVLEEVAAELEGEDLQVAFNANYLIDALRAAGNETVSLEFNGPIGPAIIRPVSDGSYLALVLPVRLV